MALFAPKVLAKGPKCVVPGAAVELLQFNPTASGLVAVDGDGGLWKSSFV